MCEYKFRIFDFFFFLFTLSVIRLMQRDDLVSLFLKILKNSFISLYAYVE